MSLPPLASSRTVPGALTHWGTGSQFSFPGEGHDYYPDRPLLTRYLRHNGYQTVSFSGFADRHQANWFYAGWSEFHTPTLKGGEEDADEVIGQVFQTLDELGVLEETAIIVTADHGEAIGEQGIYGDHVCADEAVHNIPLIIRRSGVTPGSGPWRYVRPERWIERLREKGRNADAQRIVDRLSAVRAG
jgi:hypothetical protein